MGFGEFLTHIGKAILSWIIGGLLILFGVSFATVGLTAGTTTGNIFTVIGIIMSLVGILVIIYFTKKHQMVLRPGYVTRQRYMDY